MLVLYFIIPMQIIMYAITIYELIDSIRKLEQNDRLQRNSKDSPH